MKRVVKVSGGKIRLEAEEPSSKADISREDVQRVSEKPMLLTKGSRYVRE